jgi:hypothetical protein
MADKTSEQASSGASPATGRWGLSTARWSRVLALAILGAFTFELILPLAWKHTARVTEPFSATFFGAVIWIGTLVLFYIVVEPIRMRRRQWRALLWYPPLWLAIVIGWVLAAASEFLPSGIRPQTRGPDWIHVYPVFPIVLAFVTAILVRHLPLRLGLFDQTAAPDDGPLTWPIIRRWLSAGERPITSRDPDLFGHRAIASRITHIIGREQRSVALLGQFGSGKTSILNRVRADLGAIDPAVIVATFDVWAIPRPEDVPRLALNRIISALDDYVDTIEFRRLPVSYQRLAAAEPTGRLGRALGMETASDSIEEIERFTPILEAINASIVLIVEDVERAGEGFETRHLERLLWTLKSVQRSAFILATDPDHAKLDFPKLCDTLELVPPLTFDWVLTILATAYAHWMSAFSDIDPHPNRKEKDKFQLEYARLGELVDYFRRTGRDTPIDALISLLATPRALKHVLRRVDHAWTNLHGEAELDDILIIAALRHGAEPAYRFLVADIDAARHKPDDMFPRTKTVREEWDRLIVSLPNGAAVQRLVDLLGIKQLTRERAHHATEAPQGVHVAEPVDYFRRIVAEELGPTELRDQAVLTAIDKWKTGADRQQLIDGLVAASDDDVTYARRWEHFSSRHANTDLTALTTLVAGRILTRDHSSAAADHPGLLALWRQCNRRLHGGQHYEWLRTLIVSAVSVSLEFVNGLYYYWTGDHGIVDEDGRTRIRQSIVDTIRTEIRTVDDLVGVLSRQHPYNLGRLIAQTGKENTPESFAEWRDHLAPLIIEGGRTHPEAIVPELANLVGDEQSGMVAAKDQYPPFFANRYKIDREKMSALFGESLDDALTLLADYAGDNAYAQRPKGEAKVWLDERRRSPTDAQPEGDV